MDGVVIYSRDSFEQNRYFAEKLLTSGRELGMRVILVHREDIQLLFQHGVAITGNSLLDGGVASFAIVRSPDPLLSFHLESMGIRCFNSARVSEICNDKARSLQFAAECGLTVPDSIVVQHAKGDFLRLPYSLPVVVKSLTGSGGKEVYLCHSIEEVREKLQRDSSEQFLMQPLMIPAGRDVRVYVLGGKVIGAILRQSSTSFKANISLGGTATSFDLPLETAAQAERLAHRLGADYIGVDFLLLDKGRLVFNEVEDVVGARSLYGTSTIDVAMMYLEHIHSTLHTPR